MRLKFQKGFTLIEMMLVLVIISLLIWASIGYMQQRTNQLRIDKTTVQMQQVLNAALSYYVANGKWPVGDGTAALVCGSTNTDMTALVTGYLPSMTPADHPTNPLGGEYSTWCSVASKSKGSGSLFYVWTRIPSSLTSAANAQIIAGQLPLGYSSGKLVANNAPDSKEACTPGDDCYAVASVNIPGQNLNNAPAISFAGEYHHGGCVPVPDCPAGSGMVPSILVVPTSVSGLQGTETSTTNQPVYPLESFTASAVGGPKSIAGNTPACPPETTAVTCPDPTKLYWRACLTLVTAAGPFTHGSNNSWAYMVSMVAFTRCAIPGENTGSDYTQIYK